MKLDVKCFACKLLLKFVIHRNMIKLMSSWIISFFLTIGAADPTCCGLIYV